VIELREVLEGGSIIDSLGFCLYVIPGLTVLTLRLVLGRARAPHTWLMREQMWILHVVSWAWLTSHAPPDSDIMPMLSKLPAHHNKHLEVSVAGMGVALLVHCTHHAGKRQGVPLLSALCLPYVQLWMLMIHSLQAANIIYTPRSVVPFLRARMDAMSVGAVQALFQVSCTAHYVYAPSQVSSCSCACCVHPMLTPEHLHFAASP
jgi:hypothetical protein